MILTFRKKNTLNHLTKNSVKTINFRLNKQVYVAQILWNEPRIHVIHVSSIKLYHMPDSCSASLNIVLQLMKHY